MNCADNWHCCPRGTHCSPDCNFRSCKCLFPSFHPAHAPKLSKEAKERKMKSKSHSESHSTSGKLMKYSEGQKEVSKTEKGKKKKTKAKDTSAAKSRKKTKGKSKHKLKLKDKKNKKHKQSRKDKGKKKTKKSRSKAKYKGDKSEKLKKLKKTGAIHKINKHVVKAHRTYQQNNFHPTTKQHWVALLDKRIGAVTKHKANIKFSHTWGKRKHQKLSFKSNGKKNKGLQTDASMADELKHLIVKHRKEKLGRRLKLRVNGHTKHKHGSHRNGFIDGRKSTKRKKEGSKIHPTHPRNIFKHRDSHSNARNKNVNARKTSHEVKSANIAERNKSRHEGQILGHQNRVSVNVFNNLRQTLHEKVLAKENISLGLNPSKRNGKIANTSDNKTDESGKSKADIIIESEKATDSSTDLQRTSSSSNKNEPQPMNTVKSKQVSGASSNASDNLVEYLHKSTTNSSRDLPSTSFRERTSSRNVKYTNKVNFKEMSDASSNASINLVEHLHNSTSNSSSAANEGEPSNSVILSVPNVVAKEGRIQPQVDERELRANSSIITKPNPTESGIDERTAGENQNRLVKVSGKVKHTARQHNKTMASNGTKNLSSTGTESVPLVKGMRNQAKADSLFSGSGLQVDEIPIGSASGLEMATTGIKNVSSADTKSVRLVIGMPRNQSKADWVASGSGLEADEFSIESASGLEMATTGVSGTDVVRLVKGMDNQAKADRVVSGGGLEADEFSTGSADGVDMATTFSGGFDDSSIDELIKVFLGGEDTESSTIDLEKNETTKELPLVDSSSESSTNESEGSYKTSPWKSLNAESADVENFSGSSFETFSSESDGDPHFGGEGDHDYEEKPEYGDDKYFDSSGRDDIYQSRLFPSNGTTSLTQVRKLKTTEKEQSIPDISQMTYNDWDDGKETYSGLASGHYESSTDQWGTGSGEDGFSSESLPTEAKPISSRNYTAAKTLNIADSIRQSSGDADEERNENKMVNGEGINLEKRTNIVTSNSGSQMQPPSEEKRRRSKSLRQKHTEKAKDVENNEFLSWEDRELKQLLYWLSTANDDDNNHFNQIMAYKDIASGYSKLHSMVLQNRLPHFSKSERNEVKGRNGNEKENFRPDTSLVSSPTGSGTESSDKFNFFRPEFKGDAEHESEFKEGSNVGLQ